MKLTADELRELCQEAYQDGILWDKRVVEDGDAEWSHSAYIMLGVVRMALTIAWRLEIFQEDQEDDFIESLKDILFNAHREIMNV